MNWPLFEYPSLDRPEQTQRLRSIDTRILVISAASSLLLVALYISILPGFDRFGWIRLLGLLPIISVSYFYGVEGGLLAAAFFGSIFSIQLISTLLQKQPNALAFELVGLIMLSGILPLLIGDFSSSIKQRRELRSALESRELLLSRTLSLEDIAYFLIEEIHRIIGVEKIYIFLPDPIFSRWEIYQKFQKMIPNVDQDSSTLLGWVIGQTQPTIINDLSFPGLLTSSFEDLEIKPKSIMCIPLRWRDGEDLGRLVLVNKDNDFFTIEDQTRVTDLSNVAETAIEQAINHSRTDYNLEQRVQQLASIQRASRELNASLDAGRLIEKFLDFSLEITHADFSAVVIHFAGLIKTIRSRGPRTEQVTDAILYKGIEACIVQGGVSGLGSLPLIFSGSQTQLSVTIGRSDQIFGYVVVESESKNAFDITTNWALTLLTDHLATSLENANLFQEIAQEKQQAATIIQSISNALITVDRTGIIVSSNPAAQKLLEGNNGSLNGRYIISVFGWKSTPDDFNSRQLIDSITYGQSLNLGSVKIYLKSGSIKSISLSAAPMSSNFPEPTGLVILLQDQTEKDDLTRLQNELISSMSHEMRTPLAKINSISEMIAGQLKGSLAERYSSYLDTLVSESQRLSNFLDRVLNIHQLETKQFDVQLRPIPACFVIKNIVDEWRLMASTREIQLFCPNYPLWIMADENGLHSILDNLIENAIKYTPKQTPIEVVVAVKGREFITIGVHDHGPGIPQESQKLIFERFYRISGSDSQSVYGHGIGLYVARMLAEAMGGKLSVESEIGKGSRFIFKIPLLKGVGSEPKNPDN